MASHRGAAPADELTQALMLVQGWDLIDKTVGHAQNLTDVRQQRAPLHPRPRLRQLPDHATLPQPGAYRHRLRQEETQGRSRDQEAADRKSTRLNSSHLGISYAV